MLTDEEWLLKHKSGAADDEIESFSERVSIKLDGNTDYIAVEAARNESMRKKNE